MEEKSGVTVSTFVEAEYFSGEESYTIKKETILFCRLTTESLAWKEIWRLLFLIPKRLLYRKIPFATREGRGGFVCLNKIINSDSFDTLPQQTFLVGFQCFLILPACQYLKLVDKELYVPKQWD
ncbi:hypothetical protein [Peribacillus kribbensis]|uniref:hypothetical protein n=1 Tax=Peribacillus kribbensis TaxID=356658 RepID=UPI0012DC4B0A|nr:hypothetical protein [Peribacillus kribbensis]